MKREVSDELLNAFADNELDGAEKAEMLECLAADESLRAKVCETWHLKELVRSAHPLAHRDAGRKKPGWWRMFGLPLAACLLLMVGAGSGWLVHEQYDETWIPRAELKSIQARSNGVLLHLVSGDAAEIDKALRQAEQVASARDANGGIMQVELVANGPGIRMMQIDNAGLATRIASLRKRYKNIRLIACNETMNRMRERGVEITLQPAVDVVPSAIEEIAARIDQGWRYLQV